MNSLDGRVISVFSPGYDLQLPKKQTVISDILSSLLIFIVLSGGVGDVFGEEFVEVSVQPALLDYTGTYDLRYLYPDLGGGGVTIAAICRSLTYDGVEPQGDCRLNMDHSCFGGSNITFADGVNVNGGISDHSTAIGGILAGYDSAGYHPEIGEFRYEGAAPDVQVDVYEFWRFVSSYIFDGRQFEADILTMSVGTVFEDWWSRGIEHLAEKRGILAFAGAGNGSDVFDPVLYPAAGANVIAVGVVDSFESGGFSDNLNNFGFPSSEHSSSGPTADDRCKPDIVAPGNCLVPDANSPGGYVVSGDYSSFATPVVAGTAALLVQKAKSDPELGGAVSGDGGNCVMKAILMNSAHKLPYWHKGRAGIDDDHEAALDYVQGAGVLDALGAYNQLAAGQSSVGEVGNVGWDNDVIDKVPGTEKVYFLDIENPQERMITVTVVWNRHYESEYPFEAMMDVDSDLRLEVWAIDDENPDSSYLLDHSDSINDNVEHIHCPADPNFTRYAIVVSFGEVPQANEGYIAERYGLAWKTGAKDAKDNILWYDLNIDGIVDSGDLILLLSKFVKNQDVALGHASGDINMDGSIDITDLQLLIDYIDSE